MVYVMIRCAKTQVLSAKNIKIHSPTLAWYSEISSKRDLTDDMLPVRPS